MKKLFLPFLLCLITISTSFAQSERNDYKKIDYIKVDDDHLKQFMRLVDDKLKSEFGSSVLLLVAHWIRWAKASPAPA